MTLVIGIATPKGVVLGADGMMSFGVTGFQAPSTKLFPIGSCFVVGVSGARNLDEILAPALQASALAQAPPTGFTRDGATALARDTIVAAIGEYVKHTAFNTQRPLREQIGEAQLLLGGLCSDGPLLVGLDETANWFPPTNPHYHTIGSGGLPALLLLRAYSKYDYALHPLQTSVLLVKRVLDMVAASMAEIGGQLRVIAIFAHPDPSGNRLVEIDLGASEIQDGMATWELLEEDMFTGLAGAVAPPDPPVAPA
jgi:20S proteasome alpha/beta subunit